LACSWRKLLAEQKQNEKETAEENCANFGPKLKYKYLSEEVRVTMTGKSGLTLKAFTARYELGL